MCPANRNNKAEVYAVSSLWAFGKEYDIFLLKSVDTLHACKMVKIVKAGPINQGDVAPHSDGRGRLGDDEVLCNERSYCPRGGMQNTDVGGKRTERKENIVFLVSGGWTNCCRSDRRRLGCVICWIFSYNMCDIQCDGEGILDSEEV